MLTVAVVGADTTNRLVIVKCLQETRLADYIVETSDSPQDYGSLSPAAWDVMFLDLSAGDPGPQFEVAAFVQRSSPSVWIVACSTAPPDASLLLRAMRSGVREFLQQPADIEAMREVLMRFIRERGSKHVGIPERVVAVMGARGGVGTTTLAVNVAFQLSQATRKKVLLVDLARPLGHVALMLDLRSKFSIRDAGQSADQLDEHMLGGMLTQHRSGLSVLAGAMDPRDWTSVPAEAGHKIVEVARRSFDFVLLDLGMCSTAEWELELGEARQILLVSEADVPSLWALERQIHALEAMHVEPKRIRIVINRWHRRDDAVLKSFEQRIKRDNFVRLPNNFAKVSDAINSGLPISENHDNTIVMKLRQITAELTGTPQGTRPGGLSGLFSSQSTR